MQFSAEQAIDAPVKDQPRSAFRSIRLSPSAPIVLDLPDMLPLHMFVQPLPRNRWIVVDPYAPGENAYIVDANGVRLRSFWIGESIRHIQAAARGFIWAGWGDEGIFRDRVSQSGVACLDEWGSLHFSFHSWLEGPPPLPPPLDPKHFSMTDCTALNVASDTGVTMYYWGRTHQDPLVQFTPDGAVHHWPDVRVGFARAFAIDGDRALFAVSDGHLEMVKLDSLESVSFQPVDESGTPISITFSVGRGRWLWLISDSQLYGHRL